MPDTKISGLPAVGAAADAQQIPVNDAGTTKMLTVAQLDAYILRALHVATAALAANILSADAAGRGKMAAGYFDAATVASTFVAQSITHTQLANRTRQFFVPAVSAYDITGAASILRDNGQWGVPLPDAAESVAWNVFYLPSDWAGGLTVYTVLVGGANGNIYCRTTVTGGANGEAAVGPHSTTVGYAACALTLGNITNTQLVTPAGLSAGDYVTIRFERNATNALDTVNSTVSLMGWLVSYTADS